MSAAVAPIAFFMGRSEASPRLYTHLGYTEAAVEPINGLQMRSTNAKKSTASGETGLCTTAMY